MSNKSELQQYSLCKIRASQYDGSKNIADVTRLMVCVMTCVTPNIADVTRLMVCVITCVTPNIPDVTRLMARYDMRYT